MYRDIIKRNTILSNIPKRMYFYVGVPYCGFVVRLIKNIKAYSMGNSEIILFDLERNKKGKHKSGI